VQQALADPAAAAQDAVGTAAGQPERPDGTDLGADV
jgi:hypothetical protein